MKIVECPRDAMQGIKEFIPTDVKIRYINQLLRVGFDTIDFGSFVSSKAIPQMRDTAEVLNGLNLSGSHSKLLAIVANERGARDAARFDQIHYLGFPLSISETFQQRNTNRSVSEALDTVSSIQEICEAAGKEQVVYISMGFGNPYGDPYDEGIVEQFADILITLGIRILSLADTIGLAQPDQIRKLFTTLIHRFPSVEFGAHLHSNPLKSEEKLEAAYGAGCHRFDGALKGYGGCPMAKDELVGNLATERIISFLEWRNDAPPLNKQALAEALILSQTVFQQASLQRK